MPSCPPEAIILLSGEPAILLIIIEWPLNVQTAILVLKSHILIFVSYEPDINMFFWSSEGKIDNAFIATV